MLERDLYFSVRLEQLLQRAKVKWQLVRSWNFKDVTPTSEDEAWIQEKLRLLAELGLAETQGFAESQSPAPQANGSDNS